VAELSKYLIGKGGVEVHVITSGDKKESVAYGPLTVTRIPTRLRVQDDFLSWVLEFNLNIVNYFIEDFRRYGQYDIIHCHDWMTVKSAAIIAKVTGTPLIATIHASDYGRNNGIHNWLSHCINDLEEDLVKAAGHIICCSIFMKKQIVQLFDTDEKDITVIPNGVDASKYLWSRNRQHPGTDILYVGRLVPEKGVHVLLQALATLIRDYPCLRLVICGAGFYEETLRQLAGQLHIDDHVVWTGFLDEEKLVRMYNQASMAVFPSLYEPFGIVALEAMAAGTPVIVSDTGGLGEIISHNVDGLKVRAGDYLDMAEAIKLILHHPFLANKLSSNARKKVRDDYAWEVVGRRTVQCYQYLDEIMGHGRLALNIPWTEANQQG
jgi:glycosyltransferase involved in cell wall biosynthesis